MFTMKTYFGNVIRCSEGWLSEGLLCIMTLSRFIYLFKIYTCVINGFYTYGCSLIQSKKTNIIEFQTFCCNLKMKDLEAKLFVDFLLFLVWKGLWNFKLRVYAFCWTKISTLKSVSSLQASQKPPAVKNKQTLLT